MRVLVVTDAYPPQSLGGYEAICSIFTAELRRRGHQVQVLTVTHPDAAGEETDVHWLLHRPQDTPSLLRQASWERADHAAVRRVAGAFRPEVVFGWRLMLLFPSVHLALRELGVPLVWNLQDVWMPAHLQLQDTLVQAWSSTAASPLKRPAKRLVRAWAGRGVPGFLRPLGLRDLDLGRAVFTSRSVQQRHDEAGIQFRDGRVIYNGIDVDVFTGVPEGQGSGPLRLLFAGRLIREKGPHVAIEAAARAAREGAPLDLTIAGIPSYPWEFSQGLPRMAEELGLGDRVRFLENVPRERLPELYRGHHAFLMPGSWREGFSVALLEAMASGLAVVGTTSGGSAEMLDDEVNALTVPPDDPPAVTERILRLARDPGLVRRLGRTGQDHVRRHYSIRVTGAQLEEYLAAQVG